MSEGEVGRTDSGFSVPDFFMFAVGGLTAEPLCHAGWDAVVSGEHIERGVVAILVGLLLGCGIGSFHWWKNHVSGPFRSAIERNVGWWLPLAIVLLFAFFVGPNIYDRLLSIAGVPTATEIAGAVIAAMPSGIKTESTPSDVLALIGSLRTKLDSAKNTIDSQNAQIASLQAALAWIIHEAHKDAARRRHRGAFFLASGNAGNGV